MKRFFYYFGWTLGIGFIIFLGAKYQMRLELEAMATFELAQVVWFSSIFPIVIGILLKLPKFLNEIKQNKQWTFDWVKFIAIGFPSLCILIIYVSMPHLPQSILPFIPQLIFFGKSNNSNDSRSCVGYILLDCIER